MSSTYSKTGLYKDQGGRYKVSNSYVQHATIYIQETRRIEKNDPVEFYIFDTTPTLSIIYRMSRVDHGDAAF
jgi:hypothetical protein